MTEEFMLVCNGEQKKVRELEFVAKERVLGVFLAEDGSRITFTFDVKNLYRAVDETNKDGSPLFILNGEATTRADAQGEG